MNVLTTDTALLTDIELLTGFLTGLKNHSISGKNITTSNMSTNKGLQVLFTFLKGLPELIGKRKVDVLVDVNNIINPFKKLFNNELKTLKKGGAKSYAHLKELNTIVDDPYINTHKDIIESLKQKKKKEKKNNREIIIKNLKK